MAIFDQQVIIIEHDFMMVSLYRSMIDRMDGFRVVGTYTTGLDAVGRLATDKPNIVLLSIYAEDEGGFNTLDLLRKRSTRLEVIGIINFLDNQWITKAMEYGISSLVLRSNRLTEIEKACKITGNGGSYLSPEIVRVFITTNQRNLSSVLTTREIEVIRLISIGKTYSMIANELNISNNTSKSHIKNIYSKLSVSNKAEAIKKAIAEKII